MYTASDFSLASLENYFGGLSPPKFPRDDGTASTSGFTIMSQLFSDCWLLDPIQLSFLSLVLISSCKAKDAVGLFIVEGARQFGRS